MSRAIHLLRFFLLVALMTGCSGRSPLDPSPPAREPQPAAKADPRGSAESAETAEGERPKREDPCALAPPGEDASWIDRTRRGVHRSVCSAALWFDSLFAKDRAYEERDETFGWIRPTLEWDDVDGLDASLKMRAKISLPAFDNRLNAVFGRTTDEAFIEDAPEESRDDLPRSLDEGEDDEWLLGLGYTPVRNPRRRFDFTGGFKLRAPPDVFVQGRYRRQFFIRNVDLVRFRQTAFWDTDDGLGFSTQVDFEHLFESGDLIRWRSRGKLAQQIDGVEWSTELTLFQSLAPGRAIAWQAEIYGETDEVSVKRYALRAIYRRQMYRDWLFLELRPGLAWIRHRPEDERRFTPTMGVGFELHFGKESGTSFR